ncbi:MAG: cation diffusion facilitator family transporter [Alistipes sp.]|jgi:cation diffusion facilitator family transporter|nr:cation diffusion facilitator family transporter [Alistipes sp.]
MRDEKREKDRALVVTSWISTAGNALLAAAKIGVGIAAGSMAVLGDGVDSATDVVISLVMLVAAFVIRRPPSRRFPFGYDKAESVATIVLSLVIFFAGVQMLVSSVGMVLSGEERELPGRLALWVTVVSIVGKLALAWYQFRVGRRCGSALIVANAKNMRNDVLISCCVLAGLFFTYVLGLSILDAITGFAVSLFIIRTAVEIFFGSGVELMDGVRDEEVYRRIFDAVERVPEAQNPHHLRTRLIGGRHMIDLDIEVDGAMTVAEAHEIADRVEESIRGEIGNVYDIEVHIEPLGAHRQAEPFGVEPQRRQRL